MALAGFSFVIQINPYARPYDRPILMASSAVVERWPQFRDGWIVIANQFMHDHDTPRLIVSQVQYDALKTAYPSVSEPTG